MCYILDIYSKKLNNKYNIYTINIYYLILLLQYYGYFG